MLSLKQLTINFPPGTTQAQATPRVAGVRQGDARRSSGCGTVDEGRARRSAPRSSTTITVRIRDLPPQLQEIMLKLQVGQATPPFGSLERRRPRRWCCAAATIRRLPALPGVEQIQAQLEQERVNLRAQQIAARSAARRGGRVSLSAGCGR